MDVPGQMKADITLIEAQLAAYFAGMPGYGNLLDAMAYSLLTPGKRLRPVLTLAACRMCGGDVALALPAACAVEMVHTYSLIHDDLPCMDNDDFRRGKPSNHKVFGEASAVLAGDGLLTCAFETILAPVSGLPPERTAAAAACLARAAGAQGMVGGQALDMAGMGQGRADLEELCTLKTGALIAAAAELGAILAGADEDTRAALRAYGTRLGLAFQVRDDMLDVEGNLDALGKPIGSDTAGGKTTFVTILGLEGCRALVREFSERACHALDGLTGADFLCALAEELTDRKR